MTMATTRPEVEAIIKGQHSDPFAVLGMHEAPDEGDTEAPPRIVVRAFQPRAGRISLIDSRTNLDVMDLDRVDQEGFFEGTVPDTGERFPYRLRVEFPEGPRILEDPFRFPMLLGEMDIYLLAEGNHLRSFEKLGAHPVTVEGVPGTAFAVWAPNARRVSVVGDFNGWDGRVHPMRLHPSIGVWEIFLPGVGKGARYKFELIGRDNKLLPLKADPYGFYAEKPPATASVVHGLPQHAWQDQTWMASRAERQSREAPISVYEVHLGSWMRVPEEDNRFLTYRELADKLVPYVNDMGFSHIELLPVSEFPFDGSWGYQPVGMFAATSRFGEPEDFQYFVDRCHQAEIGVLIDWVPGHFPSDAHGLAYFDGTHLYEHADPRKGFHMDWNTLIYNYGRREVANFLLGSALFWMDHYHIDGLRVDAVASMLYLDYSRKHGEWIPNEYGGNENLEAIELLKRMNYEVFGKFPGATTAAEESTAWPAVSRPIYAGGLGFGFKWNMGWMHDTLRYMQKEPVHRRYHHNDLTFGLLYAFTENFILPLSHDEVVHGKGSMLDKMSGDEWQKFANLRAYYAFMWTMPGKKLLFMGGEFGQWQEWYYDESLHWHLLEYERHVGLQDLVRDLNRLYATTPALHELDCEWTGFEWIEANDLENSVVAYIRKSRDGVNVIVVCNLTPVPREDYRLGVPAGGFYVERLNTDAELYGGSNKGNAGGVEAEEVTSQGRPWSLLLTLPPLATLVLQPEETIAPAVEEEEESETLSAPSDDDAAVPADAEAAAADEIEPEALEPDASEPDPRDAAPDAPSTDAPSTDAPPAKRSAAAEAAPQPAEPKPPAAGAATAPPADSDTAETASNPAGRPAKGAANRRPSSGSTGRGRKPDGAKT